MLYRKKRGLLVAFLVLFMLGIGVIMGSVLTTLRAQSDLPILTIIGDVDHILEVTSFADYDTVKITYRGENIEVIPLGQLLAQAATVTANNSVLLMASDSMVAEIQGGLELCYIAFRPEFGWHAINPYHPISSNVKHLKEIVVIAEDPDWDDTIQIISPTANLHQYTVGQLYKMELSRKLSFVGRSSQGEGDDTYYTSVYNRQTTLPIIELAGIEKDTPLAIFGAKGEIARDIATGYLVLGSNYVDYHAHNGDRLVTHVKGFVIEAPNTDIMQAYYDAQDHLLRDEKVMVFLLDGFSWEQYTHLWETDWIPNLSNMPPAQKALSVYRPVTNAGLAAMLTGQPPAVNGVYFRERQVKVPTIFSLALEQGKKAALIQSSMQVIETEIAPILNIDLNDSGYTDLEVFNSTREIMGQESYDLIFVHFKGIDIAGHAYGPLHHNTLERIKYVDELLGALIEDWQGGVIITSDHGMHADATGGSHGHIRYEDLVVPYILIEGGRR